MTDFGQNAILEQVLLFGQLLLEVGAEIAKVGKLQTFFEGGHLTLCTNLFGKLQRNAIN